MPKITVTHTRVEGDFENPDELIKTLVEVLGFGGVVVVRTTPEIRAGQTRAAAPAQIPTPAPRVVRRRRSASNPTGAPVDAHLNPKSTANGGTDEGQSISSLVRTILAKRKRMFREMHDEARGKMPQLSEQQLASALYGLRKMGEVRRVPGSVGMGADAEWEMVHSTA